MTPTAEITIQYCEPTAEARIIPRLGEDETPIVGRWYEVPTLHDYAVVGKPHVDKDHFNRTPEHYHIDSRFHNKCESHAVYTYKDAPNNVFHDTPIVHKPLLCVRSHPEKWPEASPVLGAITMSLHMDFHGHTACGVCPHKGMPIHNGVCTGHRLKWCKDGTIKHKPPYTISVRDHAANKIVIAERVPDCDYIEIPVVEAFTDRVYVDMHDKDGELVATHVVSMWSREYRPGEKIRITSY